MRSMTRFLLAALAVVTANTARAADPVPGWVPPGVRDAEFTRMYFAIQGGSRMGPGEGWFGPSETRYTWAWLAVRQGVRPTSSVTRTEFRGPPELFDRLDRDGDGSVKADDFDWSDTSAYARQFGQARQWLARADADGDGGLSRDEWDALFQKAVKGKDRLDPEAVRRLLFPPPTVRAGGPPDFPSKAMLLNGLFSGEIGSPFSGPRIGQPAPDFTLKTQDGKRTITLSDYRGRKPVALIFGSFT